MTTYTLYAATFDWPAVFGFTVDAPYSVDALAAGHVEMEAAGYYEKAGYVLALADPKPEHRVEQLAELKALAREKTATAEAATPVDAIEIPAGMSRIEFDMWWDANVAAGAA